MTDNQFLRRLIEDDPTLRQLFGSASGPRYRYYEADDGRQFVYTTERVADGKFASAVYVPRGKGARSGRRNVIELRVSRELHHATRRGAKARAYRLYQQHKARLEARNA